MRGQRDDLEVFADDPLSIAVEAVVRAVWVVACGVYGLVKAVAHNVLFSTAVAAPAPSGPALNPALTVMPPPVTAKPRHGCALAVVGRSRSMGACSALRTWATWPASIAASTR